MKKIVTTVMIAFVFVLTGLAQNLIRQSPENGPLKKSAIMLAKMQPAQQEPKIFSTPFVESFNSMEGISERWSATGSDPVEFLYSGWDGYGDVGHIGLYGYEDGVFLISCPIKINSGEAHLSFYYKMYDALSKLQVLYGKSAEPADMTVLDTVSNGSIVWQQTIIDFTADDGQAYYFAFHPIGDGSAQIDAIEIDTGAFVSKALPVASDLVSPMPGCDLEETEITVKIGNQGELPVYGFTAECIVNDRDTMKFSFRDTIPAGENKTFRFPGIRLQGGDNAVQVKASDFPYLIGKGMVYNHLPLIPPHAFDFSRYEMMDKLYYEEGRNNAWMYADTNGDMWETPFLGVNMVTAMNPENPFLSMCIQLDANVVYTIGFDYKGGLDHGRCFQRSRLFLGEAGTDWQDWNCVWHDSLIYNTDAWIHKDVSVSVPRSGLYSFAFINGPNNISMYGKPGGGLSQFQLKDIVIAIDEPAPQLNITNFAYSLPPSGCDLDELKIDFKVVNVGDVPIDEFSAWYTLNDTLRVEEFFERHIDHGGPYDFSFSEKVRLSPGTKNTISVGISGRDRTYSDIIYYHFPLQTPHTIDLAKEEASGNNSWFIQNPGWGDPRDPTEAVGHNGMNPLQTTCFEFQANTTYRIAFDYAAGSILFQGQQEIPDECLLFFYRVGEDWKKGERIWYEPEVLSGNTWESAEVSFRPDETGLYAFAFTLGKTSYQGFYLKNIHVSEWIEHDVRLTSAPEFARLMPSDQVNTAYASAFRIENRGTASLGRVRIQATVNDSPAGDTVLQPVGQTEEGRIDVSIDHMAVGDTGIIKVKASIEGYESEDINPDHEISARFSVTDTVMSWYTPDTINYNYIGFTSGATNRALGIPFVFRSYDTLTSVSVGWCATPLNLEMDARLCIYRMDATRLRVERDPVYSATIHRGKETGWTTYAIPDLMLSGPYFVALVQTTPYSYGLSIQYPPSDQVVLYTYAVGEDTIYYGGDYGTPAIRLNLGHRGKPSTLTDIAPVAILEPYSEVGAFSVNQPIRVKIQNFGNAILPDVEVGCLINGEKLAPISVSLDPHATKEVAFTADLSRPETTYQLCVFTSLEGDENRSNDTLKMTIRTLPSSDPYIMDFEYCGDFAVDGFEPAWTTLDQDQDDTYGWKGLMFPHAFEKFGFIAFNPHRTQPAIDLTESPEIAPYQGSRFGASFATLHNAASDWLISPKLKMPAQGAHMGFYVKSFTRDYGYDQYKVLVSTTDNKPESFEEVGGLREAPSWDWTSVWVDLSAYNGKDAYVAIQRVQENGYGFCFMIDDIRVSQTGVGVESSELASRFSLYPNPAKNEIFFFSSGLTIDKVEVYNVSGQKLFNTRDGFKQADFRLNVANWRSGIYFARVYTVRGEAVLKFTVAK